ncbi:MULTISPECIES: nucleotidyltransferase domain-containing protein [Sphingomonadales]|uniref:nucleotidyltransferase family protein n=1 Tax=Sphingomonadales TaxID=204457 RepID=UPI000AC776D5|nr:MULTISPECIES: nucleotidyltransferase domain-containing protein [Sphingomonadales]MAF62607.1 DNA polymerase III subunit beta [Blastomonas sp.]
MTSARAALPDLPILADLKALEGRLRKEGVCSLYLFGSHATGDASTSSDIDLLFDIAPDARFSLFDQARISRELGETLKAKVDFIPRRALHPLLKSRVEAQQVRIFG